jgi:parallel beta-helix repeat protein
MTSRVHRMFGSMALFAGLALSLPAVQPAAAATEINACPFVITAPGQYRVANDLVSALPGPCITIAASDVHLNLNGHTITGPTNCLAPVIDSTAIAVGAVENVHINNGTVGPGFFDGIRLAGTTNSHVNAMLVTRNCVTGFLLTNAMNNRFRSITVELTQNPPIVCAGYRLVNSHGNVVTSNEVVRNGEVPFINPAFELNGSNSNTIQSSLLSDNHGGVRLLGGSDSNVLRGNTVTNNRGHGIEAGFGADRNLVQANTVTGSLGSGIYLQGGATFNTVQANRAMGNGPLGFDGQDDNPACDNNTWKANNFGTTNQPCVD